MLTCCHLDRQPMGALSANQEVANVAKMAKGQRVMWTVQQEEQLVQPGLSARAVSGFFKGTRRRLRPKAAALPPPPALLMRAIISRESSCGGGIGDPPVFAEFCLCLKGLIQVFSCVETQRPRVSRAEGTRYQGNLPSWSSHSFAAAAFRGLSLFGSG